MDEAKLGELEAKYTGQDCLQLYREEQRVKESAELLYLYFHRLVAGMEEAGISQRVLKARAKGLGATLQMALTLSEYPYDHNLIATAVEKKIAFIMAAGTMPEIDEICKPQKPVMGRNGMAPDHKYHIPEEELLYLSYYSQTDLLSRNGINRYAQLTKELMGFDVEDYVMRRRREEQSRENQTSESKTKGD